MMICAFKSCVFFYRSRLVRLDMLRLGCVLSGNETSQPFNHGVLQIYDLHLVFFCFLYGTTQVIGSMHFCWKKSEDSF